MAIKPNPDRNTNMMKQEFGTVCLITDIKADYYLQKLRKNPSEPPLDRYSKWCGGKNGFDDYVERWH